MLVVSYEVKLGAMLEKSINISYQGFTLRIRLIVNSFKYVEEV